MEIINKNKFITFTIDLYKGFGRKAFIKNIKHKLENSNFQFNPGEYKITIERIKQKE